MNQQQLQKEILSCIWSTDLKNHVEEHNYTFSNAELLSIVYHFVPTYRKRLRLLQLLAEHAPDISELAGQCVRFQQECLEQFCQHGENEVYELRIKEDPESYEERYLCASYQTALDMIDGFYREYDFASEPDTVSYVIAKRKILQATDAFREDAVQECILGAGKVLLSVELWRDENDPKTEVADAVASPIFIPHLSAVRYRLGDNRIGRGVHLCLAEDDSPSEYFYVIPLDCEMLKSREYEKHWGYHWHEHIPGPNIEILPTDELTETEKSNYLAFVQYWQNREETSPS